MELKFHVGPSLFCLHFARALRERPLASVCPWLVSSITLIVTPQLGALLTLYSFAIAICLKYRPWMSFPLTATDDAFYLLA